MDPQKEIQQPPVSLGSANPEEWWTRKATELAAQMHLGGVKRFVIQVTPKGSYKFEIVPIPMKRRRIECPERTAHTPFAPATGYAAIPRKKCDNCYGKGESDSALGPIECNWCRGTGLHAVDFGKLDDAWKALHDEIHALRAALKKHERN